jgi:hypothetical protein
MKLYEGNVSLWTEWLELAKQGYSGVTGHFSAKRSYCVQRCRDDTQTLKAFKITSVPPIETLYGGPELVGGNFDVSYNDLSNLNYAPKFIGGYIDVSDNLLTSLDGLPANIDWNKLRASYNNLPEPLQTLFNRITDAEQAEYY